LLSLTKVGFVAIESSLGHVELYIFLFWILAVVKENDKNNSVILNSVIQIHLF